MERDALALPPPARFSLAVIFLAAGLVLQPWRNGRDGINDAVQIDPRALNDPGREGRAAGGRSDGLAGRRRGGLRPDSAHGGATAFSAGAVTRRHAAKATCIACRTGDA